MGKGEWIMDFEWFFEASPLGGEEGQRDEEERQRAALSNLRRLLGEYGFAATLEQLTGSNRSGGFLRAVGGMEELRAIEAVVWRFEPELPPVRAWTWGRRLLGMKRGRYCGATR